MPKEKLAIRDGEPVIVRNEEEISLRDIKIKWFGIGFITCAAFALIVLFSQVIMRTPGAWDRLLTFIGISP